MGSSISWQKPHSPFCCREDSLPRLINVVQKNEKSPADRFSLNDYGDFSSGLPSILHDWPYDLDPYDDHFAEYLVVRDPLARTQLGSLRLLRTDRSHVLGSIFPDLCKRGVPCGFSIREITQIYLYPKVLGRRRRAVANQLASALIQYGLLMGIESFTMIIETVWSGYLQAMGWRCEPLGPVQTINEIKLAAFQIHVDWSALEALRTSNCYVECDICVMEPNPAWMSLQ